MHDAYQTGAKLDIFGVYITEVDCKNILRFAVTKQRNNATKTTAITLILQLCFILLGIFKVVTETVERNLHLYL